LPAALLPLMAAPVPRMLRAAALPPGLLEDPAALIPLHFMHRFVETCATSQGLENLGARLAAKQQLVDATTTSAAELAAKKIELLSND